MTAYFGSPCGASGRIGGRRSSCATRDSRGLASHVAPAAMDPTRKSRASGRPPVSRDIRALVREMATANPLWGAPRIHGELRTLGVDVSERTVSRLLTRLTRPPSQTWRTFLTNHLASAASMDFFTVSTLTGRVLFVVCALPPSTAHRPYQHDGASDRRVGCATGRRGFSGRHGTSLDPSGSRPHLRRGLPAPLGGPGHRRGLVRAGESLAESICRARHRLDPDGSVSTTSSS